MHRTSPYRLAAVALLALVVAFPVFAAPVAGDIPPDLVGTDLDDQPVLLEDYAGKAVVVTFWATWCPYCLKELPVLQGIQKVAGEQSLQVIAVNTESRDVFRRSSRALSELGLKFAHDTGRKGSIAFGVHGIPHMVIIGRDGRILSIHRGYDASALDDIVADINKALAVPR